METILQFTKNILEKTETINKNQFNKYKERYWLQVNLMIDY
jgi:hypothetical protein